MVFFRSVRAGALAIVMCSVPAMAHAETLRESSRDELDISQRQIVVVADLLNRANRTPNLQDDRIPTHQAPP